jgi:hypothetical protein
VKPVVSVIALFLGLSPVLMQPSHAAEADADASKACAEAAFNDYNRQNLAILTSPDALPIMSVEATVMQRRLPEQYCLKFAACTVGDPSNTPLDFAFRAAFSHCVSDEEKAKNE